MTSFHDQTEEPASNQQQAADGGDAPAEEGAKDAPAEQAAQTATSTGDGPGSGPADKDGQVQKDEAPGVSEEILQEAKQPALEARVSELEAENSQLKDQYLRKSADFENFRKRMQRERQEAVQFANTQLLLDLMSVIDDFERAIKSSEDSRDFDAFHDGIVLIEKQFTSLLERKWGLKRFDSVGEEFNPERHEAILTEEIPDHTASMVLEDYQRGYILHDRVIRASKVKVSVPGGRDKAAE